MHINSRDLQDQLVQIRRLESRLTFQITVLSKLIDSHGHSLLQDTELSLTAFRIMCVVRNFDLISISDAARFSGIDRAQVSRCAADLALRGYVHYASDPRNKRKKLLQLTALGTQCLDRLSPPFLQRNAELEELLGQDRLDVLADAIAIMARYFDGQQNRTSNAAICSDKRAENLGLAS